MTGWASAKLGEACTIIGGGTPPRNNSEYYGGAIPWVTPKDMKTWEIGGAEIGITEAGLDNSATRLVPANTVLVVVRSGVLKHTIPIAINRVPVAINQDMKALLCGDRLHPDFLARFLKARSPIILQWVRATTADNFPIDMLRGLDVPLPPFSEQRRIAQILDKVDALRAKRRAALAQFDTLRESIFLDTFGDPATNPKGWPRRKLGDLIAVGPQNGLYKPADDYGTGTPILRIDAFYDGVVTNLASLRRVRLSEEERVLYSLREGEIVINRVNSREYLGKSALIPGLTETVVFESNMMRFDADRQLLDPRYLIQYLQTAFVRAHVLRSAKDAVNQSSINQQDVKAIPVVVPPITEQKLFAQRLSAVDRLENSHNLSSTELDALFASVQQKAFLGEL